MLFLLLSILSSTSVFITFKIINQNRVNLLSTIVINYFVACSAGFFLSNSSPFTKSIYTESWLILSVFLGILFILMLWVIGLSTEKVGVAVTTVASKMSVIFPISFSLWYDSADNPSLFKLIGILLTLAAVYFTVYRKRDKKLDYSLMYLPLLLFVGIGMVDSFIKFAQVKYITNELNSMFSAVTFGFACFAGIIALPFNRTARQSLTHFKTWILGVILGVVNFGTVYFLIGALNHIDINTGKQAESSILFGINNMCIVALSVILGYFIFKERPSKLNWAGIALSVLATIILTYK